MIVGMGIEKTRYGKSPGRIEGHVGRRRLVLGRQDRFDAPIADDDVLLLRPWLVSQYPRSCYDCAHLYHPLSFRLSVSSRRLFPRDH